MIKKLLILGFSLFVFFSSYSQSNIALSNIEADSVIKGIFDPAKYISTNVITNKDDIIQGINSGINPDSLKAFIIKLSEFGTRNSGSDTISDSIGIGAARRWAYSKFEEFSSANENRLIPAYLDFDLNICGVDHHKNTLAILPGTDTTKHGLIIIEGHLDSRCDVSCDTACVAQGVEDNASGSALVLELARVMSQYTFKKTFVFMLTTAEEQGLLGADAMADFIDSLNIPVRAVLNNDVIGGIACGQTSSAPSCPGLNDIDSTQVRLFSAGGLNSKHKALSRLIKLEYQEELLPIVSVPMQISIMSAEDRSGRGGDHIPFRQKNIASMRFTSANEHGNASVGPGYTDRQHTSDDILGLDTDGDQVIDSFFVDFNYLARNAVINGTAATVFSEGPGKIEISTGLTSNNYFKVEILSPDSLSSYKVGVRTLSFDFDTIFEMTSKVDSFPTFTSGFHFVSATGVDSNGLESTFSDEYFLTVTATGIEEFPGPYSGIQLLQNKPNPFDEATFIAYHCEYVPRYSDAFIHIRDINGKEIEKISVELRSGMNELLYQHGYKYEGTYIYSLVVDGNLIDSKKMVFAF